MKSILQFSKFLVLAGGIFFVAACGSDQSNPLLNPGNCKGEVPAEFCSKSSTVNFLVLVDKSASVLWDEIRRSEHLDYLKTEFTNVNGSSDRVTGVFIHENTRGAAPFLQQQHQVDCPSCKQFFAKGTRTQEQLKRKFEETNANLQDTYLQRVVNALEEPNTKQTNRQTDIWGSIEVMSSFFASSRESDDNKVFFLSDMLESSIGKDRRNFTRNPPRNKAEAMAFAKADLNWINRELQYDPTTLKKLQIVVLGNNTTTDNNSFALVKIYWQSLFSSLGVEKNLIFR